MRWASRRRRKICERRKPFLVLIALLQRSLFMSSYASTLSRTQGISLLCHELLFERCICMQERSKEEVVGQDVIKWPLSTWRCVALEASSLLRLHLPTFRDTFCVSRWSSFSSSSSSSETQHVVLDSCSTRIMMMPSTIQTRIRQSQHHLSISPSLASWPFYPFFIQMFFQGSPDSKSL